MLQAFAAQGGPAGGRPQQNAPGALVGGGPDQVADPLEAEHRVVDVHRQHRLAMHRIGGGRRDPGRQGAGFGDAFFQ
ncbi:hypothetical protein D3C85_1633350 [compost metagenome]